MVGRQNLDLSIGVRIPAPQQDQVFRILRANEADPASAYAKAE